MVSRLIPLTIYRQSKLNGGIKQFRALSAQGRTTLKGGKDYGNATIPKCTAGWKRAF